MREKLLPIIIAAISVFLGILGIPDPKTQMFSLVIVAALFVIVVVWIIYDDINKKFNMMKENKKEIRKLKELLDIHRNIFKLEERMRNLERKK